MMISNYKRNQGLALISVLLIFAIAAVILTSMQARQSIDVQRTSNIQMNMQMREIAIAIEDLAKSALAYDFKNSPDKDTETELATFNQMTNFPLGKTGFKVTVELIDAQSRFNINNLAPNVSNLPLQQDRFKNLLNNLGLNTSIASSVVSFMDPNSQADNIYMSLPDSPYRASYELFKHPSELLLVDGVTLDDYYKLEPYISALPNSATLNINTALDLVVDSLAADFSGSSGNVVSGQEGDGYGTVDDFWGLKELEKYKTSGSNNGNGNNNSTNKNTLVWDKADFSVNSNYFEIFATIIFDPDPKSSGDEQTFSSEFLVFRENGSGTMRIYYRDFSRKYSRMAALNSQSTSSAPGSVNSAGSVTSQSSSRSSGNNGSGSGSVSGFSGF